MYGVVSEGTVAYPKSKQLGVCRVLDVWLSHQAANVTRIPVRNSLDICHPGSYNDGYFDAVTELVPTRALFVARVHQTSIAASWTSDDCSYFRKTRIA